MEAFAGALAAGALAWEAVPPAALASGARPSATHVAADCGPGHGSSALCTGLARYTATSLLPGGRLQLQEEGEGPGAAPPPRARRYLLPAVLSAVVPGAGEIASGHLWNGLPLVAADIATWIGYAHYEGEGDRIRDDYQRFADQHWSENRWQDSLVVTDWYDPSAPYNCDCSPPYIPKAEDAHEYYENLGKYRHFYPGWDDWSRNYAPENPASRRRQYVDMRIASNDSYENADTLIGVAALTRVVSVVQCIWLVHRDPRRAGLMLEPVTFRGFGSGLRVKASF